MKTLRSLSASLALLVVTTHATAYQLSETEPPYGASKSEVAEAARNCDKNEMTIAICAWSSYRQATKTLRSAVKEVESALGSDTTRLAYFKRSQKAWGQFRNADCDVDASSADGGSMVTGLIYSCREILTNQRVALLRSFVKSLEAGSPIPLLLYERR